MEGLQGTMKSQKKGQQPRRSFSPCRPWRLGRGEGKGGDGALARVRGGDGARRDSAFACHPWCLVVGNSPEATGMRGIGAFGGEESSAHQRKPDGRGTEGIKASSERGGFTAMAANEEGSPADAKICGGLAGGIPMAELEQVFRRYDANGDGKISAEELASVLRALGAAPGPGEVARMMEEMDADRDGFVDLREFAAFHCGQGAANQEQEAASEAELKEAFRMYDADRNGLISARELHRVLRQLGDKCSVADCSRMIRSVDADGDGSVNFDEFKKMMGGGGSSKREALKF
ncbi:hypothetical protein BRADI_2g31900v3 [Brachypodium distachyon]|uniref:EF-hand domain-containing protein n=2 Tax=Brachypodium distachyon TaxID=15368 RepID=A0A2K2DBE1_BRADI|nr:hypothetical protein BRADI_2g31900v3 [Brachypodium distachyon]